MRVTFLVPALVCLTVLCPLATAQTPDMIWQHFANWVRESPATTVRDRTVMDLYTEKLIAEGVSPDQARQRVRVISTELRLKSRANSMLYWDAMFKFGGGPDRPLRLLADVSRDMPPGRAVDVAMGNGRNSLYLASLGWNVISYDISPGGIAPARERAANLAMKYDVDGGIRRQQFWRT